jgi:hypothetical protein
MQSSRVKEPKTAMVELENRRSTWLCKLELNASIQSGVRRRTGEHGSGAGSGLGGSGAAISSRAIYLLSVKIELTK